jgi:hypothetical protein
MLTSGLCAGWLLARVLAQAEAAPPEPPPSPAAAPAPAPPPEIEPPRVPTNTVAVHGRFAYRPGDDGTVAPRGGFSLGATFHHRYARLADVVGLGAEIDFFHDHFSSDGQYITVNPRRLTHDSFVALQTLALEPQAPVRPWIAAGGGLTIAQAGATEIQPVVRGALGLDVTIAPRTALVLRGDYTMPLTQPALAGVAESPFGGFLDVGLGFLYWF